MLKTLFISVLPQPVLTIAVAVSNSGSPHVYKQQAAAAKKTEIFERAERYVKEYRAKENDSIRFRREAKAAGNIHVPAEVRNLSST